MTPITRLNPALPVTAAPPPSPLPGRGGDFQSMLQDLYASQARKAPDDAPPGAGDARSGRLDKDSRAAKAGGDDEDSSTGSSDEANAGDTNTRMNADRPDAGSPAAPAGAPAQAEAATPPPAPPEGTAAAAACATPTPAPTPTPAATPPAAAAAAPAGASPSAAATAATQGGPGRAAALRAGAGTARGPGGGMGGGVGGEAGAASVARGGPASAAQGLNPHGPRTAQEGPDGPAAPGAPGQPGTAGPSGPFGLQDTSAQAAPAGLAGLLQAALDGAAANPAGASQAGGHAGELPAAGLQGLQGLGAAPHGAQAPVAGNEPAAPAAQVYQAELPFHPHAAGFAPGLAAQVNFLLDSGLQQAQLRLHPADLGPIQIQLSLSAQTADISFSAASSITREGITDALPALREMLASQGLSLGQAGVSSQQADGQPGWQQARAPQPAAPASGGMGTAGGVAGIDARPHSAAQRRGMLDLYA